MIHVRVIYSQKHLIDLVEALTGNKWNPNNHMLGNCYDDDRAQRLIKLLFEKIVDDAAIGIGSLDATEMYGEISRELGRI